MSATENVLEFGMNFALRKGLLFLDIIYCLESVSFRLGASPIVSEILILSISLDDMIFSIKRNLLRSQIFVILVFAL